jgi:hypothetical protein
MVTIIDKIPIEQLILMKNKVINHLYEINEDELRIAGISEQSFEKAVARLFKENARDIGYKIALPFAHATKIVESVWNDISDGFSSAFRDVNE